MDKLWKNAKWGITCLLAIYILMSTLLLVFSGDFRLLSEMFKEVWKKLTKSLNI